MIGRCEGGGEERVHLDGWKKEKSTGKPLALDRSVEHIKSKKEKAQTILKALIPETAPDTSFNTVSEKSVSRSKDYKKPIKIFSRDNNILARTKKGPNILFKLAKETEQSLKTYVSASNILEEDPSMPIYKTSGQYGCAVGELGKPTRKSRILRGNGEGSFQKFNVAEKQFRHLQSSSVNNILLGEELPVAKSVWGDQFVRLSHKASSSFPRKQLEDSTEDTTSKHSKVTNYKISSPRLTSHNAKTNSPAPTRPSTKILGISTATLEKLYGRCMKAASYDNPSKGYRG